MKIQKQFRPARLCANQALDSFQKLQYEHDEKYHPDILSLSVADRMKHVLSHLVKYQYPLLTKSLPDPAAVSALVDAYIMLVSACNILKMRASAELISEENVVFDNSFDSTFLALFAKMAKACDSADHIEDYPIHEAWRFSVKNLLLLLIRVAHENDIDLIEEAARRHRGAESKHGLYFLLDKPS